MNISNVLSARGFDSSASVIAIADQLKEDTNVATEVSDLAQPLEWAVNTEPDIQQSSDLKALSVEKTTWRSET